MDITQIQHPRPMDPSIMWALFVVTLAIHVITFHFLQFFADSFGDFIILTALNGREIDKTHSIAKHTVNDEKKYAGSVCTAYCANTLSGVHYQPLHETLDVSIFR